MSEYYISTVYGGSAGMAGEWRISKEGTATKENGWEDEVVFRHPFKEADWDDDEPPIEVRVEYERLIGYAPGAESSEPINLVELMVDESDDCAFDQPCAFGHRVEGHAVYCHNTSWLYAPRKCRRTWYTGGEVRDEDCKGFAPNPRLAPQSQDGTQHE